MSGRLLVTGADGQVGRALVALGAPLGVIGLGRRDLDLTDRGSIEAAIARHRPTAIINAAAYTAVDAAEGDEAAAFAVNAEGAGRLAHAAAVHGAAFIHISTDYVFDGDGTRPYRETDVPVPLNAYGRTKLAGERLVLAAHPTACVVRTSWVHAATGRNFIRTMLDLALTREAVTVVADQTGALTYAPDLAAALLDLLVIVAEGKGPRLLHLAGSGETSWFAVAEAIFARLHADGVRTATLSPVPSSAWPSKARRPMHSVLDCGLASATYGLTLPDWRDGLRRCLDSVLDRSEAKPRVT